MPMVRRRSSFRGRRGSRRRKLVWDTARAINDLVAGDTINFDLLAPLRTAGSSVLGVTVMRTIVRMWVIPAGSQVAGETFSWGVLVGQDSDLGMNVAGQPDPSTDLFLDWAYITDEVATGSAPARYSHGNLAYANSIEQDIRSRRRVQEMNQTWSMCISSDAPTGLTVVSYTRVLLALP